MICQEPKGEPLTCPAKSKRKNIESGYRSLTGILAEFNELGASTMVANNAQCHQSCRLKYNNTKLLRAQKRALATSTESVDSDVSTPCKRRRLHSIEINT